MELYEFYYPHTKKLKTLKKEWTNWNYRSTIQHAMYLVSESCSRCVSVSISFLYEVYKEQTKSISLCTLRYNVKEGWAG